MTLNDRILSNDLALAVDIIQFWCNNLYIHLVVAMKTVLYHLLAVITTFTERIPCSSLRLHLKFLFFLYVRLNLLSFFLEKDLKKHANAKKNISKSKKLGINNFVT